MDLRGVFLFIVLLLAVAFAAVVSTYSPIFHSQLGTEERTIVLLNSFVYLFGKNFILR